MRLRLPIILTILVFLSAVVLAADWPQWRGPNRNGVVPDSPPLAQTWPPTGPTKLWQSEHISANDTGGAGSVTIADGKAYVFANLRSGYKDPHDVVFCLDASTGKTLWKMDFPGSQCYGFGTSGTPCVVNGSCYVTGGTRLYCLDAATGQLRWQTGDIGGELSSSPLYVDGVVVLCTGILRGFDAATGVERWQQPAAGHGNNTSAAGWVKDGKHFIITNMGHLCCIDPLTGQVLWTSEAVDCCATPVISGDFAVVGSPVSCYKLSLDKAEKVWSADITDRGSTPLIYQDYVYAFGRGGFHCLELATGHSVWDHPCKGEISSPILADGKVIAVVDAGSHLVMFQASPKQYVEYAAARLLIGNCTSPAVAQGKLYLRLHDSVGCFDLNLVPDIIAPRHPENPPRVIQGLRYAYFGNYGSLTVDDIVNRTPTNTGVVTNFDLTPRRQVAEDHFAFTFTGYLEVKQDGLYTFYAKSNNGSKLYLGETLVVDNDAPHDFEEIGSPIALMAGRHALTLYYYLYQSGPAGMALEVSYEGPGVPKQRIPDSALFRTP